MIKPIELSELQKLIEESCNKLSDDLKIVWDSIKITPEKWNESSKGAEMGGFWVVAKWDDEVIWYNDIEKGFSVSTFKVEREIGEYWSDQCDLDYLMWHLFF